MITDEQFDRLLYRYTSRQDEFNMSVIKIIADRLSKIADFDNLNTLDREKVMQEDITKINEIYGKYVSDQRKRIREDFWWIAVIVYLESLRFYEEQLELKMNKTLNDAVTKIVRLSEKSLVKAVQNPVFVIRDLKTPAVLKAYDLEKTYRSVMQEALSYKSLSDDMRTIALKRTETQLFDSGIRYLTDNSSDSAKDVTSANNTIRFNVLDSMKNLINKMQDIMGKQFGANAVELSAHIYPAPDHAPAQGHQYSLEDVEKMQSGEDFKDLQGNKYVGFERNIGQWNCRHYFMRIKKGTEPTYTQKQLDKILADNERGYTDAKGKHRTLYECTQVQRRYEREIRRAKEKYLYGKALNNKGMMAQARNRVGALTTQYKQFSQKCGISAKLERIRVKDYN
jgi:hypothetical protein